MHGPPRFDMYILIHGGEKFIEFLALGRGEIQKPPPWVPQGAHGSPRAHPWVIRECWVHRGGSHGSPRAHPWDPMASTPGSQWHPPWGSKWTTFWDPNGQWHPFWDLNGTPPDPKGILCDHQDVYINNPPTPLGVHGVLEQLLVTPPYPPHR